MRHQRVSKKFSRNANQRKNLYRALLTSLILNGGINTTLAKAKYLKKAFDKLVFKARKDIDNAKRRIYQEIPNRIVVKKFLNEILPLLPAGTGLTTLVRLGKRKGDNAEIVKISIRKNKLETKEKTAEKNSK